MHIHLADRWMYPCHTDQSWPQAPLLEMLAAWLTEPEHWQITDVSVIWVQEALMYMSLSRLVDLTPGRWERRTARLTQRLGYALWAVDFDRYHGVTASVEAFAAHPDTFAHYFVGEGCATLPRHAVRQESWQDGVTRWGRDVGRVWQIPQLPAKP
jgi:hypothetical protein